MILTKETKQKYSGIGIYNEDDRNYVGDHVNGKEHGVGMYENRFIDNTPLHRYVGQFNDNKVEGIGIKSYFGGKEIYCGEYKNDKRNGIGYWKLPTGAIFVGEHKYHIPNGSGMLITWEGFKFIGYVRDWKAWSGTWYDQKDKEIDITELGYNKNGTKYVGEYKDDKMHGQGTATYPNGSKYVGGWKDNKYHGQGTFAFSNGEKYVGEFNNGGASGQGTLTLRDTYKYEGGFNKGVQDGQGTLTYPDGKTLETEWKNGGSDGQGTLTYPDGSKYVGETKNCKKHGQGTLTYPDGSKYVGEWKDDKRI